MAQVDIFFSTSATDALAGTELKVEEGTSENLYVWVDNQDSSGNPVDGLPLDISGSGASSLMANTFVILNPIQNFNERWFRTESGILGNSPGLLIDNSGAASLTRGIANGVGPVLHGILDVSAVGPGSNSLELAVGNNVISVVGQAPQSVSFGTANVVTFLLGDAGQNGAVSFADIGPFILLLANNEFLAEADTNRDNMVSFADIGPFILILAGN